jgi:hypothetical protein
MLDLKLSHEPVTEISQALLTPIQHCSTTISRAALWNVGSQQHPQTHLCWPKTSPFLIQILPDIRYGNSVSGSRGTLFSPLPNLCSVSLSFPLFLSLPLSQPATKPNLRTGTTSSTGQQPWWRGGSPHPCSLAYSPFLPYDKLSC